MITKKQIDDLKPLPFEQKIAFTRYRNGDIVPPNIPVWGQDKDGNWGWKQSMMRIKKGKFERGFHPILKKK